MKIDLEKIETFSNVSARLGVPYIAIIGSGRMSVNSAFRNNTKELLEKNNYVILHYLKEKEIVIFEFVNEPQDRITIKLSKSAASKSCLISSGSFFRHYNLAVEDLKGRYKPFKVEIEGKENLWAIDLKTAPNAVA